MFLSAPLLPLFTITIYVYDYPIIAHGLPQTCLLVGSMDCSNVESDVMLWSYSSETKLCTFASVPVTQFSSPPPPFSFISAPPPPSSQLLPALSAHFNSFIYLLCHCLHLCQCHHPPYRAITTHIHLCCHCPCIVCCHHSMLLSLYPALPLSVDHCHHCCCCCPPVTVAFCSCL